VKIARTVDNVEGIFVLKLRSNRINDDDQFVLDDPYGRDLGGDGYLEGFLAKSLEPFRQRTSVKVPDRRGYRFVDAVDPADGRRYRYTGSNRLVERESSQVHMGEFVKYKIMEFVLDRVPAPGPAPRYGITYDDISTREDREHWIAGSSLRVIDLKTDEVIAERIGYMFDPGQGSRGGNRSPWLMAASFACPAFPGQPGFTGQARQAHRFAQQVLQISEKE
jgi:hypothetical protein